MRNIVIMGAGGRDFHVFATVFRDDPDSRVLAFTAAQIPGIDDRTYPYALAGPLYPDGIPIVAEEQLVDLIRDGDVDEVVFAYSDVAHADVMHQASRVLAAGADFRLAGPGSTMLSSSKPVIGIGAVRTGCGKSQTTRAVGRLLLDAGLRVALIRHPMPYGDLEAMRVQRFADAGGDRCQRPHGRGARGVRDAGRDGHGHVRRAWTTRRSCGQRSPRLTSSSGTGGTTTSRSCVRTS